MNQSPTTAPKTDANPEAAAAAAAAAAAPQSETPQTTFERAKLIAILGLPETATDAEIEGLIADLRTKAGETATVQTSLQTIQAERDTLRADYDALYARQQDLDKKQ